MNVPDLKHEKLLWKKRFLVIGVDEVGRGCLAGPLTVGAVCFPILSDINNIKELEQLGINDSKKLSSAKRRKLSKIIKKMALYYSTAQINVSEINRKGIVKATEIAMRKAVRNIKNKIENSKYKNSRNLNGKWNLETGKYFLLADAFYIKYVRGIGMKNQKAIIHGDEKSISIAAASIIAKVERDKLMTKFAKEDPRYKWHKNKGYGTANHIQAIKKYGTTKYHRNLFVRKIVSFS